MLHLVTHPLVHECLAELRDSRTAPERFRALTNRISVLLGAEALRAGLGMLPGMLELVPDARVGHLGLQRDERTAVASQYYAKLPPNITNSYVLLIDPMLATGGSAVAALDMLTRAGARHLRLVCIVAAPEGVAAVEKAYPTVPIFTPAVDRELNAHKFIVPGLGDFGDRLFGTI